jgi:hypothetical protein
MKNPTPAQIRRYIKNNYEGCPKCGNSEEVLDYVYECCGDDFHYCKCEKCGLRWKEVEGIVAMSFLKKNGDPKNDEDFGPQVPVD